MADYFNEEERADFEELLSVICKYHSEIRKQTLKSIGVALVKEVKDMINEAGLSLTDSIVVKGDPEEINILTRLFRDTERRNRYVIGYLHELTFPITANYYNNKILKNYKEFDYNEITLDDFHASTLIILGEVLENHKNQNIIPVFKRRLPDILRRQKKLENAFSTTFTDFYLKKVADAEDKLAAITGHNPTVDDIAAETGFTTARVKIYLGIIHRSLLSYETMLEDDNRGCNDQPTLREKHILDIKYEEDNDEYAALYTALDCIEDEVSRVIIFSKYGICGYEYTKDEICEMYGISSKEYKAKFLKAFEIVKEVMAEITGVSTLTA